MAITYNGRITKNDDSFQQLKLVVKANRKKKCFKTSQI